MLLMWGVIGGPWCAAMIFLYGGICVKSFQEKVWVILLMCCPVIGLPYMMIPWHEDRTLTEFIPIAATIVHWFLWFHEDFIKLFDDDSPNFFKK
tara:strand:+ start:868 stop:1149 length:282 start_codon:yes stop_codon:yes gene_type:complete